MKIPAITPFLNEWIVILHSFHQLPHSESLETAGVDTHAIFTKLIADDWCGRPPTFDISMMSPFFFAVSGSLNRWDRFYIITNHPIGKDYTTYISPINMIM